MKQLTNAQPLAYRLPNSEMVTSLAYIDDEIPELKSKVQYLIKSEQANMVFEPSNYLKDLQQPNTPFADSEQFKQEVQRIMNKLISEGEGKKQNKNQSKVFQISAIKKDKMTKQVEQGVRMASIRHQMNLNKQTNLQIYHKFGPSLMKEQIAALDSRKRVLEERIQEQKRAIEEINKRRKYNHLEAQEREETISSRTKVMIHKKRRVD